MNEQHQHIKIYLDEPLKDEHGKTVFIDGHALGYTQKGAYHLLEHYQLIQSHTKKMGENEQKHLQWLIARIKNCIAYYEQLPAATGNGARPAA